MEGPEPDRLEPSAPAAIAADFTAAKPGTSEARFGSAIESTSERDNNSRSLEYKRGHEAADVGPLTSGIAKQHLIAEQAPRSAGFHFDARVQHRARQPGGHW